MPRKSTTPKIKTRKKRTPKLLPPSPISSAPTKPIFDSSEVNKKEEKVCWVKKIISWFKY